MSAVRIVARLRPPLPGEVCDDGLRIISHQGSASFSSSIFDANTDKENSNPTPTATNSNAATTPNLGPGILVSKDSSTSSLAQHYPFHSAYSPAKWLASPTINAESASTSTQSLFTHDILPLLDQVLFGATVTVFAYGVTSSGKTYTMQGNGVEDKGIIGLVVDELFKRLESDSIRVTSISMSYLELYLDTPYDLLVPPTQRRRLQILSTSSAGTTSSHSGPPPLSFGTFIHLPNLSIHPIDSPEAFRVLYADAARHRSTGATLLNSNSSRSHAVLTLYVTLSSTSSTGPRSVSVGKIHLLDLAGSENNNLTGNNPERMKESSAINKSLTALGQVVNAINDNARIVARATAKASKQLKEGGDDDEVVIDPKSIKMIPYRSSSLTRLLSDALGGPSLAVLIVCLAPGTKFRSDLVRSVCFASQARRIENKILPLSSTPLRSHTGSKVPTSKTFSFAVPFQPSAASTSMKTTTPTNPTSNTVTFPSLSSSNNPFPRYPSKTTKPSTSSRRRRNSLASSVRSRSRDGSIQAKPNGIINTKMSPKKRTRRVSFIPVPQSYGLKSGEKLDMVLEEGLNRLRVGGDERLGRLSMPSKETRTSLGGTRIMMTEEEMQERISKAVDVEVERRLAELRAEGLLVMRDREMGKRVSSVKSEETEKKNIEKNIEEESLEEATEELREELRGEIGQEVSMMLMQGEQKEELDDMAEEISLGQNSFERLTDKDEIEEEECEQEGLDLVMATSERKEQNLDRDTKPDLHPIIINASPLISLPPSSSRPVPLSSLVKQKTEETDLNPASYPGRPGRSTVTRSVGPMEPVELTDLVDQSRLDEDEHSNERDEFDGGERQEDPEKKDVKAEAEDIDMLIDDYDQITGASLSSTPKFEAQAITATTKYTRGKGKGVYDPAQMQADALGDMINVVASRMDRDDVKRVDEDAGEDEEVDKLIDDNVDSFVTVTSNSLSPCTVAAPSLSPISVRDRVNRSRTRGTTMSSKAILPSISPSSSAYASSPVSSLESVPKRRQNEKAINPHFHTKRHVDSASVAGGQSRNGAALNAVGDEIVPGTSLADSTSDAEKGRAWVLQGKRAESTDLPQALSYYRRAATFVPDNAKLKDRIRTIERAIATKTSLPSSPERSISGRKVLRVKRRGESSISASSWLPYKSKASPLFASVSKADTSATSSLTSKTKSNTTQALKISSSKKRKFGDDPENAFAEQDNRALPVDSGESPKKAKKRKVDGGKGKGKARAVSVVSERDQIQDEGEWEIPASAYANLDYHFGEPKSTSGSGHKLGSSSGLSQSPLILSGTANPSPPLPPPLVDPKDSIIRSPSRPVFSSIVSFATGDVSGASEFEGNLHPDRLAQCDYEVSTSPPLSSQSLADNPVDLAIKPPGMLSPISTTSASISSLSVVEKKADIGDQMEVDEVASALEDIGRGSSAEPSIKEETNDLSVSSTCPRSVANYKVEKGLTYIKEEEKEQEQVTEPEPELTVESVFDRLMQDDEARPQSREPTKNKSKSRNKKNAKNTSKSKPNHKESNAGWGQATCDKSPSPPDSSNQENIQPAFGSIKDVGSTRSSIAQAAKRKRYVYGSSDEEEDIFVKDAVPGPAKKKRLNMTKRRMALN